MNNIKFPRENSHLSKKKPRQNKGDRCHDPIAKTKWKGAKHLTIESSERNKDNG